MDTENIDVVLISLVEKCPTLYDKQRKDFKDAIKKKNAWQTINNSLGINGELRWKVLRDRYVKEKRKEKTLPSGSSAVKSSWPYLKYLSFLDKYITSRNTVSNITKTVKPTESEIRPEQPEIISEDMLSEEMLSEEMLSPIPCSSTLYISNEDCEFGINAMDRDVEATPISNTTPQTARKANAKIKVQSQVDNALEEVANYLKNKPDDDSDATFGKYVGNVLKELTKRKKIILRRKIMDLIEEVETMDD